MKPLHLPGMSSGLRLALFAAVAAAALGAMQALTAAPIAHARAQRLLQALTEVLPGVVYDNSLVSDRIERETSTLGKITVYRARNDGRPAAAVLKVTTPDGYSGDIELLVGIRSNGHGKGRISGVRVIAHRETPGLGDRIELRHGNWIRSFDDRSLDDPPAAGWAVRKDGGSFDQFTGATITPRAVVAAVRRSLEYFTSQGETLFADAAQDTTQTSQTHTMSDSP